MKQYNKTIRRLAIFRKAGRRGLSTQQALKQGITYRQIKWLIKQGYVFAGVYKPQRYYRRDFEHSICLDNPRIAEKRLRCKSVPLACATHRLYTMSESVTDINLNDLGVHPSMTGHGVALMEQATNLPATYTGRQADKQEPIRYLTTSINGVIPTFSTAYELQHGLVKDPYTSFGSIGNAFGYMPPGYYERLKLLVDCPTLSLHHLQCSFSSSNPLRYEAYQRYVVDGIPITVRQHKGGTTSIWTSSTARPFKDSSSIAAFMGRTHEVIGYGPPIQRWNINQLDVAKDLDTSDWRLQQ